jgi:hypothetical protein
VTIFGDKGFKEVIKVKSGQDYGKKEPICKARKKASGETKPATILILDFSL